MDNQLFFKSQQYQLRLTEVVVMRYIIALYQNRGIICVIIIVVTEKNIP